MLTKEIKTSMEQCSFCSMKQPESEFYMYRVTNMTRGRIQRSYVCKSCSDSHYGDEWYPITGYDEACEISNRGVVRKIENNRHYNITHVQNAGKQYVYLHKNGKMMTKNILPLMNRFLPKNSK